MTTEEVIHPDDRENVWAKQIKGLKQMAVLIQHVVLLVKW